jgi:hypothetical protein
MDTLDTTAQTLPALKMPSRRKSVFMEVGLVDEDKARRDRSPAPIQTITTPTLILDPTPKRLRPTRTVRFQSQAHVFEENVQVRVRDEDDDDWESDLDEDDEETLAAMKLYPNPNNRTHAYSGSYRVGLLALMLALMLPVIQMNPIAAIGVRGGVVRGARQTIDAQVIRRDDTNPQVCKRWSHQAAVVNGTLYVYGGRASTSDQQTSDTWSMSLIASSRSAIR